MSHALTTPITYLRRKAVHAVGKSVVHRFALVLVWLTVASSCIVFSEPAPVDVLNIGLFVLLPAIGLVAWKPALTAGFSLWIAIAAFGYLSAIQAPQSMTEAIVHNSVSFYLYGSCFVFALFVAKRPGPHTALILNAMLTAAVFAALLGIVGYLNLIPGTIDLFTRYGRASAAFKDPQCLWALPHYWTDHCAPYVANPAVASRVRTINPGGNSDDRAFVQLFARRLGGSGDRDCGL